MAEINGIILFNNDQFQLNALKQGARGSGGSSGKEIVIVTASLKLCCLLVVGAAFRPHLRNMRSLVYMELRCGPAIHCSTSVTLCKVSLLMLGILYSKDIGFINGKNYN